MTLCSINRLLVTLGTCKLVWWQGIKVTVVYAETLMSQEILREQGRVNYVVSPGCYATNGLHT
jgi:hypothetical protein